MFHCIFVYKSLCFTQKTGDKLMRGIESDSSSFLSHQIVPAHVLVPRKRVTMNGYYENKDYGCYRKKCIAFCGTRLPKDATKQAIA